LKGAFGDEEGHGRDVLNAAEMSNTNEHCISETVEEIKDITNNLFMDTSQELNKVGERNECELIKGICMREATRINKDLLFNGTNCGTKTEKQIEIRFKTLWIDGGVCKSKVEICWEAEDEILKFQQSLKDPQNKVSRRQSRQICL